MATGDGHCIAWQVSGHRQGKPALLLHGGPGSGSFEGARHMFDPTKYSIVQFDQRNCGDSTPHASAPKVDLTTNTTQHLIADIEQLRNLLGFEQWLVWGGSWGTTLGLAYAQAHPASVSELLLSSVVTTTADDVQWITRTMGQIFPQEWARFRDFLPAHARSGNLALAYNQLLMDPDPAVHLPAAIEWCRWEDVHVSIANGFAPWDRYEDPDFRLAFARLVTHYWANAAFLDDDQLLHQADRLGEMPVFMAHGRLDISAPTAVPVALKGAIANAQLFIAEREGHGGAEMTSWMTRVANGLAS